MNPVELSKKDIQMLIKSLEHCMATCQEKAHDKSAICKDCDTADDLKKRLGKAMKS